MYNKEALRKELEYAMDESKLITDRFSKENYKERRDTYISNRLAALDDGNEKHRYDKMYERMKEYFATKDPKELIAEFEAMGYEFEDIEPVDDGQEGKGQAEDYLKASVGKALNIDFSKEQWYIDWWMLLDPQPSFRCIIRAMEAYKAAIPVGDGEGEKVSGRTFKWYYPGKNEFPNNKEKVQFDDKNNILHLGTFYKKDQFGRENVFVSTEGAYFEPSQIPAWIPIFWKNKPPLPSSVTGGVKEDAVGFAEWLITMRVDRIGGGYWEVDGLEKIAEDGKTGITPVMSTERLYQLFKSGYKSEGQPD